MSALDGQRTRQELQDEFGKDAVDEALTQMESFNVIEDAADDDLLPADELERFDRQLRYFSDVRTDGPSPSETQQRLREAKIAILGVGGLGGWSALALACAGIGEFLLVDGDRIETSNFNRQILYTPADRGLLKAERAAAFLRAFDPAVRVQVTARKLKSESDVSECVAGSDVVVDAADWPAHDIERWCNSACFAADVPFITMSHFPPVARVGPLFVPGTTGCYLCYEAAFRSKFADLGIALEQRRGRLNPAASLGAACGMIGGQVAMDVLHLLTGLATPASQGCAHIYDLRWMAVTQEPVVPDPNCPICGR